MVSKEVVRMPMQREPLHYHFVRVAKQNERKIAFIDRGLNRTFTYSRALSASLLLADKLKKINEPLIGIMLPTSAGAALVILALLMNGKTPVFLNYSTGVQNNVDYARKKCDFKTVITAKGLLEKLKAPVLDGFIYTEDLLNEVSLLDKMKAAFRASFSFEQIVSRFPSPEMDKPAAILFTTGSELEPKAVPLSHQNITANLEALSQIYPFASYDIMLASLPFFHVFGLTTNLWLPLHLGMTIVSYVNPMDYKTICTVIAEEKPTYLVGTPSFLWGYLHHSQPGDFKSLKLIVTGADKCSDTLREAYREKYGIEIYEGYGTTETSPVITVNTPDRHRPGSVGSVLPNLQIRIERYETDEECTAGETGKILVKGESVFAGYFDDFEASVQSFRNGWYDTGDMGYMDADGFLWFVGRLRRFVKIGGEMVSLIRVEESLEKLLPQDTLCCVVEVPDAMKGAKIIAAFTKPIQERQVLQNLSKQLPAIALPSRFVVLEDLPKMASGKTDFKRTTEIVLEMIKIS
jgi:acyl-[acyl-carrier-protein]-phospholipid O-acyltransferase/long-chain-fatty-acid--[acyl-carrier-protein] ligase